MNKLILTHRKKVCFIYFFFLKSSFREKVSCTKTIVGRSLYIKENNRIWRKLHKKDEKLKRKFSIPYFHLIVFLGYEAEINSFMITHAGRYLLADPQRNCNNVNCFLFKMQWTLQNHCSKLRSMTLFIKEKPN